MGDIKIIDSNWPIFIANKSFSKTIDH